MDFYEFVREKKAIIDDSLNFFFLNELDNCKSIDMRRNIGFLHEYTLNGGKRLRPISAILSYNAYGRKDSSIILPASAIEILHTSSLIFDDLMDEDDFRRGQKGIQLKLKELKKNADKKYEGNIFSSYSKKYAVSMSILIGLKAECYYRKLIYDSGFSCHKKLNSLMLLDSAYQGIIRGQELDIEFETSNIKEEEYLEMIRLKTAILFGASLEIGAYLAGADKNECTKIRKYGEIVATAFQIQDDLLDIDKSSKKGHEIGSDIRTGKKTLLYIYALRNSSGKGLSLLNSIFGNKEAAEKDIRAIITLYSDIGAIDYCKGRMLSLLREGNLIMDSLNISNEYKEAFYAFSESLVIRKI